MMNDATPATEASDEHGDDALARRRLRHVHRGPAGRAEEQSREQPADESRQHEPEADRDHDRARAQIPTPSWQPSNLLSNRSCPSPCL